MRFAIAPYDCYLNTSRPCRTKRLKTINVHQFFSHNMIMYVLLDTPHFRMSFVVISTKD